MKFKSIYITLLLLLLTAPLIFAQNIKIGIGGGYGRILDDTNYSQCMRKNPSPSHLGLRNWYSINSIIKYSPASIPVIFTGEINYLAGRNDSDYLGYYSPLQSGPMNVQIETAQNIISGGIGIESPVIHLRRLTPYFSLGLSVNYIGEPEVEWTPALNPLWFYYSYPDDKSAISNRFRGGLNFGIGADYALTKMIGLDISARYNFLYLVGQKDTFKWEKVQDYNMFTVTARILFCLRN